MWLNLELIWIRRGENNSKQGEKNKTKSLIDTIASYIDYTWRIAYAISLLSYPKSRDAIASKKGKAWKYSGKMTSANKNNDVVNQVKCLYYISDLKCNKLCNEWIINNHVIIREGFKKI